MTSLWRTIMKKFNKFAGNSISKTTTNVCHWCTLAKPINNTLNSHAYTFSTSRKLNQSQRREALTGRRTVWNVVALLVNTATLTAGTDSSAHTIWTPFATTHLHMAYNQLRTDNRNVSLRDSAIMHQISAHYAQRFRVSVTWISYMFTANKYSLSNLLTN